MERIRLSEQAISICEKHYEKKCGGCPLRPECPSPSGPGQEGHNRWVEAINEKAKTLF